MSKIDLQNSSWCQIIFEGRNREYGAYALRRDYSRHAMKALLIAVFSFSLCSYAPILAAIIEKKNKPAAVLPDTDPGLSTLETPKPKELPPPEMKLPTPPAVKEIQYTTPEIVRQAEVNEEDLLPPTESIPDDVILGNETKDGLSRFEVPMDVPADGKGREAIVGTVSSTVHEYATIQKKPMFPGGMDKILPYVMKNFRYPRQAIENNIQGTVFVQFTIDRDGSIIDVKALRGQELGGGLAEEAVRIVKAMPKWEPGEQNGRKVKVRYTIPVIARSQE
ncbi:protein TonB [Anseongella ginsenosidimutans]|uniref:Protein TonB n=1 Tax=Anseongella ginsenosidimutans TaxID=496056 RepID=A0A4V2UTC8_9SPHI|nr:energy transducer TonB [Anseongella ginsenosidimutans]TCS85459.1 protein TonB [Anseongella ginsenosidimutans]